MTPDLRKRLEEAAKKYALNKLGNQFQDEYPHRRRTFAVHSNFELDDAFVDGAEHGYKEAIEVAKEWIRDRNRHACKEWLDKECADFETDMNKLWEEEKNVSK